MTAFLGAVSEKSTPRSVDQPVRQGRTSALVTSVVFNLNMGQPLKARY